MLTKRQVQILQMVADGKAQKEIAKGLGISFYTVKNHLVKVLATLGATNASNAVAIGFRRRYLR